ncbi:unnamed protein product [Effrenium voratum]|nr:unnamed protein product [Effrenium voratum]|mmetsp:Transcript_98243/g.233823  ORF Transcript_98243/g.233823 Transcript_98243/m.233823 type:complete len:323 (-) Transcript_98243:71-1039(-)
MLPGPAGPAGPARAPRAAPHFETADVFKTIGRSSWAHCGSWRTGLVAFTSVALARRKVTRTAVLPRLQGVHVHEVHELPLVERATHAHELHEVHEVHGVHGAQLGSVVRRLYSSFNECDADGTASCFTEDVVYEDLLLGNSTIVQSREEFLELIRTHPVFVSAKACGMLGLPPLDLQVKVDSMSEDTRRYTVGVEWHVEVGGQPLVLGRGLSFMKICRKTGLIAKATDIAEAPWRAIGLLLAPFARGIRDLSRLLRDWSFSSVITVVLFAMLFLDRSSLDMLRDDIDTLDDFRNQLDQSDHSGLKSMLAEMVANVGSIGSPS